MMKTFNRTLTAVDLSKKDEQVLQFSDYLFEVLESSVAYFLHIIPDFLLPENMDLEFHKLFAPESPIDEKIIAKLAEDIQKYCPMYQTMETHIEVVEGQPYKKLIHWLDVKTIDLLVVGNKKICERSGITAQRVARKASSSICYVGDKAKNEVQKILVGVDFSDYSLRALQAAIQFKKHNPNTETTAIKLINLPNINFHINKNYPELKNALFEHNRQRMNIFLKKHQLTNLVNPVFKLNNYFDVSMHLREYAQENNMDLIIVGAKGHTPFENFLFGSVTEKLVKMEKEASVLVVR